MPTGTHLPSLSIPSATPSAPSSASHRSRSASLSIARSPSILSARPSFPFPNTSSELESQSHGYALSRIQSQPYHTRQHLENISGEDGASTEILRPSPDEEDGGPYPDDGEGEDEDEEEEQGLDERLTYTGGFQPPDTREMVGMGISFAAVVILAVAAGLTTIYDWVL